MSSEAVIALLPERPATVGSTGIPCVVATPSLQGKGAGGLGAVRAACHGQPLPSAARAVPPVAPILRGIQLRPNERCPCGSGRKVKKCCGVHEVARSAEEMLAQPTSRGTGGVPAVAPASAPAVAPPSRRLVPCVGQAASPVKRGHAPRSVLQILDELLAPETETAKTKLQNGTKDPLMTGETPVLRTGGTPVLRTGGTPVLRNDAFAFLDPFKRLGYDPSEAQHARRYMREREKFPASHFTDRPLWTFLADAPASAPPPAQRAALERLVAWVAAALAQVREWQRRGERPSDPCWEASFEVAAALGLPESKLNQMCRRCDGHSAREIWDGLRVEPFLEQLKAEMRRMLTPYLTLSPALPPLEAHLRMAALQCELRAVRRREGWTKTLLAWKCGFRGHQRLNLAVYRSLGQGVAEFEAEFLMELAQENSPPARACISRSERGTGVPPVQEGRAQHAPFNAVAVTPAPADKTTEVEQQNGAKDPLTTGGTSVPRNGDDAWSTQATKGHEEQLKRDKQRQAVPEMEPALV